ncbi:MAG: DUF6541 family protein, partial [Promethearchaeota archaeon]
MEKFALNLLILTGVFVLTVFSGKPITLRVKTKNPLSKIVLAFAFGFGIITFSGMIGQITGFDFFVLPAVFTGLLILVSLRSYQQNISKNFLEINKDLKENRIIYLFGLLTTFVLVYFFSQIIMWTAGDGTFHSSVIRLIVEGEKIPISLNPTNGGYVYYPKGFHFYAAFFVRLFGLDVIEGIKIIPILIVVMISFAIFAITKELNFAKPIPTYAFMISFTLWKHFYPLIWMGYPQITADFFIVTLILTLILELKNKNPRFFVFLFTILYLIHPRHFLYSIPVLLWMIIAKAKGSSFRNFSLSFLLSFGIISLFLIILGKVGIPHFPAYIYNLGTGVESFRGFIFIWNIGFFAVFGIYLSSKRRGSNDLLILMMFFSWIILALLIDSSTFRLANILNKRVYSKLFIPVSIFTAYFLERMTFNIRSKFKVRFVAVDTFLIFLLLITSAFVNAPILGWAMAESDYSAMKSLNGKTGIVINLDPTGRWVYPLTGLTVSNPRVIEQMLNDSELEQIISSPTSKETNRIMDYLKKDHGSVYIFMSQRTRENPGYLLFDLSYPR